MFRFLHIFGRPMMRNNSLTIWNKSKPNKLRYKSIFWYLDSICTERKTKARFEFWDHFSFLNELNHQNQTIPVFLWKTGYSFCFAQQQQQHNNNSNSISTHVHRENVELTFFSWKAAPLKYSCLTSTFISTLSETDVPWQNCWTELNLVKEF